MFDHRSVWRRPRRYPLEVAPGWEGFRNRLRPEEPRITRQEFGHRASRLAGGQRQGEIGGWISRSVTPAPYARAIPRRTLDDGRGASGRFAGPDGRPQTWSLRYSPRGAQGRGLVTFTLNGETRTMPLPEGVRQAGATYDRFGMFNVQSGGTFVEVYGDDLSYTTGGTISGQPSRAAPRRLEKP